MAKVEGFIRHRAQKIGIFNLVNKMRLGMGPKTRLSIDREFDVGANVNVLSSTLFKLYRAMPTSSRVEM